MPNNESSRIIPLFPHQMDAVDAFYRQKRSKSVLFGDAPRVGKTLPACELERRWRKSAEQVQNIKSGRTLVVSPKSVMDVWVKGLMGRGVPRDTITVIDPRNRVPFLNACLANEYDYYVMHYDALAKLPQLAKLEWFCVIADEAHNIKGRDSQRTKALKKIKSQYKIGTTGTPADNRPEDMWSILNWLWKKEFSSYWKFVERYLNYWQHPRKQYKVIQGPKPDMLPEYWSLLEDVYIRRELNDVVDSLPPFTYTTIDIPLTGRQRTDYLDMAEEGLSELELLTDTNTDYDLLAPYTINVFTRLQQLAIGECTVRPYQKWNKELKIWEQKEELNLKKSPKADWIIDYLRDDEEQLPLVIMCQHNDTADFIARQLDKAKITCVTHTGLNDTETNQQAVDLFQEGEARVFIGTFGTAREGLDLSRSGTIVMVDRPWRTKWNEQAENRIRNLLKTTNCHIIDLVARIPETETIDEYRLKTLDIKNRDVTAMTVR